MFLDKIFIFALQLVRVWLNKKWSCLSSIMTHAFRSMLELRQISVRNNCAPVDCMQWTRAMVTPVDLWWRSKTITGLQRASCRSVVDAVWKDGQLSIRGFPATRIGFGRPLLPSQIGCGGEIMCFYCYIFVIISGNMSKIHCVIYRNLRLTRESVVQIIDLVYVLKQRLLTCLNNIDGLIGWIDLMFAYQS